MRKTILILWMTCFLLGCIGGGTHGSIKSYIYAVPKEQLEEAVHRIILDNRNVVQDSIKEYYNDDTNYISMSILSDGLVYTYTMKFGGNTQYWDTSKTASIFIAYAHDEKGYGGSSGNGGVKWYNFKLKERLEKPFEKELVSKIDSLLGIKHIEE